MSLTPLAAAAFRLDRTQIELRGPDRAKFLHNFCTNNIKALQPGDGCEAFVTSVQGKVLGHIFVFATSSDLWIDSVAGAADRLVPHLSKYQITEDLEILDRTSESSVLYVAGDEAAARLATLGLKDLPLMRPLGHAPAELNGMTVYVRRVDFLGRPGWELVTMLDQEPRLVLALKEAGITPAVAELFDALRIEAGFPWYGRDITDANLAQEVGRTPQAISFTKGCYLGQEPIARIDALGHVNQELRGLTLAEQPVPAPGAEILAGDDKVVGHVTSAASSPSDGRPIALAYVRRSSNAPGTTVHVKTEKGLCPAVVWSAEAKLPL